MQKIHKIKTLSGSQLRVGTDLVAVSRIEESVSHFGARYLNRVYTPAELDYCQSSQTEMARRLAARFAAKEATLKVIRPDGFWLDWRTIEIKRTPGGWCKIKLHGRARKLGRRAGIHTMELSMSHERDYTLAVVTATLR